MAQKCRNGWTIGGALQTTETQVAACHDELMAKQSSVATATARLRDAQSALRVKQERAGDLRRKLMQGARAALGEVGGP
jgi:hypothetical protein